MRIQTRRVVVLCGVLALCTLGNVAKAQLTIVNVSNPGAIPDATGGGIPSLAEFSFTGPSGVISDVNIQLSIAHPSLLDLSIYLRSPQGTTIDLMDSVYGATPPSTGANLQDTRLDDSGVAAIGSSGFNTAPFAGPDWGGQVYKPQHVSLPAHRLAAFNNQNAQGTWTLQVWDYFPNNVGTLYSEGQSAPWGTAAGTKLYITVVPEPRQYALIIGALLSVFAFVRARRRRAAAVL